MTATNQHDEVSAAAVKSILADAGYETLPGEDATCFLVKDPESGITFSCDLEKDILFNAVACFEVEESAMTSDLAGVLLDTENGISTSSFRLCKTGSDKVIVTLSNFCKLQDLGSEDKDDVLSCLEFLNMDVLTARDLLAAYL